MASQHEQESSCGSGAIQWYEKADVVIAGYGAAGAAAAIAAHDAGATVIVLERMAQGGGNTAVSMGGFLCPANSEEACKYFSALYDYSHSEKDEEVIRVFARESVRNVEWLKGLKSGTRVHTYGHAGYPRVAGAGAMNKYLVEGKGKGMTTFAGNLWNLLSFAVEEKRCIPVLTQTRARRLVTNGAGEVIGVMAECRGREVAIRANRAVILSTGGYEYDSRLLQNHVKGYPLYASGNPGNTGDGVRMAQKVGAGLWHMNAVSSSLGFKAPDFEAGFLALITAPGHIIVDRHGKRFVNEKAIEQHAGLLAVDHYDTHALEYPRIPCYLIFDETARLQGPISRVTGLGAAGRQYKWSKDNSEEIARGWIHRADRISTLAEQLNLPPAALEATVATWNADISSGRDTLFDRPVASRGDDEKPAYKDFTATVLSATIETPPYYGMTLYPCLVNTQGGPRRNAAARITDPYGQPIPRLYSAGELGSMWGIIYQGAGNIAECLVFGRIAGRNAANESPWS